MIELNKKIQEQFNKMAASGKLFKVELSGRDIWDLYLQAFPPELDPVFRDSNSSSHNCNHCKNFIRRYGNVVAIIDNKIVSMFDVDDIGEYNDSIKAIKNVIQSSKVSEVFFETFAELNALPYEVCNKGSQSFKLGIDQNFKRYNAEEVAKYGVVKEGEIYTFNHFHLQLPREYVNMSGASIEAIQAAFRDAKNVFHRAMDELNIDTLKLVKDLINQGSLLDGTTHLYKVEAFIKLMEEYDELSPKDSNNWCWVTSFNLPLAKFKNELIGVLCTDLAEGKDLNASVQAWNKRVDPVNYMKTTAPITKKQIEEAKKFVEENGYVESFNRRFATIDDIKASEILHMNMGKGEIPAVSIFDGVKSTSTRHKRSEFDKVEEVSIEKFMADILPGCTSVEAFLMNDQEENFVSLTTANDKESKPIFKWPNNYSWTFNGNLAGKSQIKAAVKSKGGKVDGVLRFSLVWNDQANGDQSDLDAWCEQPDKNRIGFSSGYRKDNGNFLSSMSGQLDLDDRGHSNSMHVENIYFADIKRMKDGVYKFWVNQYQTAGSKGFKAEIEFDGEIYSYEVKTPLRTGSNVHVAEVTLKDGRFSIMHIQPETASGIASKEMYGLESNQFHKVNLVCVSPNHWDGNSIGNKHYFFMLDKAKSPTDIRSFHNENLLPELAEHRKVLEVLGASNVIPSTEKQLSGLGFNSTVKDELIVKLQGTHKRMMKIKF